MWNFHTNHVLVLDLQYVPRWTAPGDIWGLVPPVHAWHLHCIQSVLQRFTRFSVIRGACYECCLWVIMGAWTKSPGSWSSLHTLFANFDCRNNQNVIIASSSLTSMHHVGAKRHLRWFSPLALAWCCRCL